MHEHQSPTHITVMNTQAHKPIRSSPICVNLDGSVDLEVTVDMIGHFQHMSLAERTAYLEFEMQHGYKHFEKPEVWMSRSIEETNLWHGLASEDEVAESYYNLDIDYSKWTLPWSEDDYNNLVSAVAWLRENDPGLEPADPASLPRRKSHASISKAPVVLMQKVAAGVSVLVDIIGWLKERTPEQRAAVLAYDSENYGVDERPYAYLLDFFASSIEVDVPVAGSRHVHVRLDDPEVDGALQYRNDSLAYGNARWWNEDDFETVCQMVPWLRDMYLASLADEKIDEDHPDYGAYLEYLERVARAPGPLDVPMFEVA